LADQHPPGIDPLTNPAGWRDRSSVHPFGGTGIIESADYISRPENYVLTMARQAWRS
jgi:hypothetical protein